MKKRFIYLFVLLISTFAFVACHDDDDNNDPGVPPTVEDITTTYSGDKLSAVVNGEEVAGNVSVKIIKKSDNTVDVQLLNIISDVPDFTVPDVKFTPATRSIYVSELTGSVSDNLTGYKVTLSGMVSEGKLRINIETSEIEGTKTDVSAFYNKIFKGDMNISVDDSETISSVQQIFSYEPSNDNNSYLNLNIKDFSFSGLPIGDISLDTIPVVKRGNVLGLQAKNRKLTLVVGEVNINVRGYILEDGSLHLNLTIVAGPLNINVTFNGEKFEGSKSALKGISISSDCVYKQPENSVEAPYVYTVIFLNPDNDPLNFVPQLTIDEKATLDSIKVVYDDAEPVKVDRDEAIDFARITKASSCILYYITPENVFAATVDTLRVKHVGHILYEMKSADTWVENRGAGGELAPFYEPVNLVTSNMAVQMLMSMSMAKEYAVTPDAGDYSAKIISMDTKGMNAWIAIIPAVTAGTLFNGKFELQMESPLKSTKFGEPFDKKPFALRCTYKYTPGPLYIKTIIEGEGTGAKVSRDTVEGKVDECSVNAYLYEVNSDDETLDGTNINSSDKVVLRATLADGTAKANFTDVEIPFVSTGNGEYDPAKKYKLAIVCSSSKEGDSYHGAPESALWINRLEVIYE